jgi:hypothetical protein
VVAAALMLTARGDSSGGLFVPKVHERERESVELTARAKRMACRARPPARLRPRRHLVGSGALIGLALILVFRLTPHRVVGTDVFHAAVLLWAAGIAHVIAGNVDYGLMANILLGSVPESSGRAARRAACPPPVSAPCAGLRDARLGARSAPRRAGPAGLRDRRPAAAGARASRTGSAASRSARDDPAPAAYILGVTAVVGG